MKIDPFVSTQPATSNDSAPSSVAVEQLGGDGVADVVGDDHGPLARRATATTRSVRSAWANSE